MVNRIMDAGDTQKYNQLALEHLEKKYGEPFAYAAPYGDSMTGTREFLVTCDSLPGQRILVQIENFRENDRIIRDNYLAVKYQDQTADYLKTCMTAACPDVNVFYEAPKDGQSPELGADASFEEYLADTRARLVVMMELKAGTCAGKEAIEEAVRNMAATCKNMALTVIVVQDEVFGTLDRDGLNHRIAKKDYVIQATVYIEDGQVRWTWRGEV